VTHRRPAGRPAAADRRTPPLTRREASLSVGTKGERDVVIWRGFPRVALMGVGAALFAAPVAAQAQSPAPDPDPAPVAAAPSPDPAPASTATTVRRPAPRPRAPAPVTATAPAAPASTATARRRPVARPARRERPRGAGHSAPVAAAARPALLRPPSFPSPAPSSAAGADDQAARLMALAGGCLLALCAASAALLSVARRGLGA